MRWLLKWLFIAFCVGLPALSAAVGLGNIHLFSDLNQPLHAEIEIFDIGDITAEDMAAGLADGAVFKRLEIDRPFYLTDLKFKVLSAPDGSKVIDVSTRDPVSQPYLNFIVDFRWPEGRLFRQYTILLDPPGFQARNAAKTQKASVRSLQDQTEAAYEEEQPKPNQKAADTASDSEDTTETLTPGSTQDLYGLPETYHADNKSAHATKRMPSHLPHTSQSPEAVHVEYGPTNHHDELWQIAKRFKPSAAVSIDQTVMALYYSNPNAFSHNNINLLKAGVVLTIPNEAEIQKISHHEAAKALSEQNRIWQSGALIRDGADKRSHTQQGHSILPSSLEKQPASPHAGQSIAAMPPIPAVFDQKETKEKLTATPNGLLPQGLVSMSQLKSADIPNIRFDNNGSVESGAVTSLPGEHQKTSEAVKDLQAELAVSAMNLKSANERSDTMKLKIQELENQSEKLQQEIVEKDKLLLQLQKQMDADGALSEKKPSKQKANSDKKTTNKKAGSQAASSAVPNASGNFLNWILVIACSLGVIGSGAYYFNRRRKLRQQEVIPDEAVDMAPEEEETCEDPEPKPQPKAKAKPQFAEVDPLEEAVVYIAYGRHAQAEQVLLKALESSERNDLKVALLEVYSAIGNNTAFEQWRDTLPSDLATANPALQEKVAAATQRLSANFQRSEQVHSESEDSNALNFEAVTPEAVAIQEVPLAVAAVEQPIEQAPDEQQPLTFESSFSAEIDNSHAETEQETSPQEVITDIENASEDNEEDYEALLNQPMAFDSTAPAESASDRTTDDNELALYDNDLSTMDVAFDDDVSAVGGVGTLSKEEQDELELFFAQDSSGNEDSPDLTSQLDLAVAYIEIEDYNGARDLLTQVLKHGDAFQKQKAAELIEELQERERNS